MQTGLQWIRSASTCLCFAVPAFAGTWIVDQNGGPGVNFTDIPPAIAAAAQGDVILVGGGAYSPFTLSKGLTILGKRGAYPTGTYISCCVPAQSTVNPPAGQTAVLADLYFTGLLAIQQSAGRVIMDRVETRNSAFVLIQQAADVRMHRHAGRSVQAWDARFEISSSSLIGQSGSSGDTALGINGACNGLVTRTSCIGGDAHDMPIGLPGDAGNGGYGIALNLTGAYPGAVLLLAGGGASTIEGGGGGYAYVGLDGDDADALFNNGCGVWRSGCTFIPGNHTGSGALPVRYVPGPGSFDTAIVPDDPSLDLVGTPMAGGSAQIDVYASPGSVVRLVIGAQPIVVPTAGVRVDRLVSVDNVRFLGVVPASGQVSYSMPLRLGHAPGTAFYAQAYVSDTTGGKSRRTNSVPIILR